MLGVMIGSACIVLVVTIALAGQHYISGEIEAVGSNIVFAGLQGSTTVASTPLERPDFNRRHGSHTQRVAQSGAGSGNERHSDDRGSGIAEWPVGLVGVTQDFQKIRNLVISRGRYFDDGDFSSREQGLSGDGASRSDGFVRERIRLGGRFT